MMEREYISYQKGVRIEIKKKGKEMTFLIRLVDDEFEREYCSYQNLEI